MVPSTRLKRPRMFVTIMWRMANETQECTGSMVYAIRSADCGSVEIGSAAVVMLWLPKQKKVLGASAVRALREIIKDSVLGQSRRSLTLLQSGGVLVVICGCEAWRRGG